MALKQETKPIYLSKTFWIQVLGIVAVVLPVTGPFIQEYFMEAGIGWALVNMILRLVTKDQIEISVSSFKMILLPALLIGAASCGLFDKDPEEGGSGGGYPDPARVCVQITPENKEQVTADFGRSCKVGDWLSKGAPTCASSLEKCMKKVY